MSPQQQQQQQHQQQQQRQQQQQQQQYVCVNCGSCMRMLHKKFSNSVKTVVCDNCNLTADKYIEFEPVIALLDTLLLSQEALRHILYNGNFKLHWKLSLILVMLESYAMWGTGCAEIFSSVQHELLHKKSFCSCCLKNIIDYYVMTMLLLVVTLLLHGRLIVYKYGGFLPYKLAMLKMTAIANFSKVFLLPVMIWRKNTTDVDADIHYVLVIGHHLLALIFVYAIVSRLSKLQAALVVLPAYAVKKMLVYYIVPYLLRYLVD